MRNLILLEYLKILTDEELRGFNLYLRNNLRDRTQLHTLFKYLKKWHPDFEGAKNLNFEWLYKKVFKKSPSPIEEDKRHKYEKRLLLNLFSEMKTELEEYLLQSVLKENPYLK